MTSVSITAINLTTGYERAVNQSSDFLDELYKYIVIGVKEQRMIVFGLGDNNSLHYDIFCHYCRKINLKNNDEFFLGGGLIRVSAARNEFCLYGKSSFGPDPDCQQTAKVLIEVLKFEQVTENVCAFHGYLREYIRHNLHMNFRVLQFDEFVTWFSAPNLRNAWDKYCFNGLYV